jgi:sulfide:quinone oxidoreductase
MSDRPDGHHSFVVPGFGSRVLIAGGGVAALEAMLALRALAEEQVTIELLAPADAFIYRPISVAAPFVPVDPLRLDLEKLVGRAGASLHGGALAAVDPAARSVQTAAGEEIPYDFLLVAVGAGRRNPLPRALAFGGDREIEPFRVLLEEIERGEVARLAFALTGARVWSLPLYELALMTARFVAERRISGVELTLVTPEERPLAIFGPRAADAVESRLRRAEVAVRTSAYACRCDGSCLCVVPAAELPADRVVTLAVPAPPTFAGLPSDPDGFVPTDRQGRVSGLDRVYAAGDVTSFPIKQGGIAAQQADVAAEAIAAAAGALVTPRPFRPVLRGLLLTGDRPAYIRSEISGGRGSDVVDLEPLWWPPAKVVAKYLGPFLAEQTGLPHPDEIADPEGLLVAWEADRSNGDWHEIDPRPAEVPA